ncbi:MAG: amidase family protein [Bacilli bacterium]
MTESTYLEVQRLRQATNQIERLTENDGVKQWLDEQHYEKMKTLLFTASLRDTQHMFMEGTFSIEQLVRFYLERGRRLWHLNAVIRYAEDAIEIAKQQDEALSSVDLTTYPLFGLPVLLKDNIAVAGMPVTAGAAPLAHCYYDGESTLAKKLKEAGAIVLGKTNLSEWSNWMSTNSINGYSRLGGQTKHPDGAFDVGGSSSGSAVAVRQHLCAFSIGTETSGSLVYPASQNGCVTIKPQLRTVAGDGIIPISHNYDIAGPMTRSVRDAELVLSVIQNQESNINEMTGDTNVRPVIHFDPTTEGFDHPETAQAVEKLYEVVQRSPYKVARSSQSLQSASEQIDLYSVLFQDMEKDLNAFLQHTTTHANMTLRDLVAWYKENEADQPFGQDLLEQSIANSHATEEKNAQVSQNKCAAEAWFKQLWNETDANVVVTVNAHLFSIYPSYERLVIQVPFGRFSDGMPYGVTIIADEKDTAAAYAFAKWIESAK